ncbi:uncharacterized protein LOC120327312 isoform X1 [Styela clava]
MAEKSWSHHGGHHKLAGLYELKKTLGRGHFAVVRLAQHVFTGENVAIKVIDKTTLDQTSKDHLYHEVTCMKLVQHPNVVRLYEVIETSSKLYLILELGDGGDMYDYIMRHDQGLDEEQAKEYFAQILCAISYCHKMHVVHRDLKPENVVFFESQGLVKLTDFGFSNRYDPGKKLSTSCGSLAYSAPEILLGEEYDAPAVDVWSLGVILYMLVCGEAPFNEANDSETLTNIMDCKYKVLDHVNKDCGDLIKSMIIREPGERMKLEDIRNHPWLKDCTTLKDDVFDSTPVLTRDLISEDLHEHIIDRMIEGKLVGDHAEIEQAINEDKYNHITSTYYLLAHRSLDLQNYMDLKSDKEVPVHIPPSVSNNNLFLPQNAEMLPTPKSNNNARASSPPLQAFLPQFQTTVHAPCLATHSESDIAEDSSPASSNSSLYFPSHSHLHNKGDKKMSPPFPREHLTITPRHGFSVAKGGMDMLIEEEERSRSQNTTDDEDDFALGKQEDEDITCARIINPVQLVAHSLQRTTLQTKGNRKQLKKRKSAPVLNEICEENESETTDLSANNAAASHLRQNNKQPQRRRHTTTEKPTQHDLSHRDAEMIESEVFDVEDRPSSEDVVPELHMDAQSTFTRTGRGRRRGSHKSSGSETSDDDSESRRTSRTNLHAVLGSLHRRRRDSSGDRDGSGSGGRGNTWGARRNSGPAGLSSNENDESNNNANQGSTSGTQHNGNEVQPSEPDNINFNNSSCAEIIQERAFFRCITPNILIPLSSSSNDNVLNNFRGRNGKKQQPQPCNHICNIPEKRSKSAESNQSNYNSSQTSSARSSSSSLSLGFRRGRMLSGHRVRKNSRSTMSDTGLVLRWNNLRHTGIPNSSSSSSIGSLSIIVPSNASSRLLSSSPCSLHRPHSEGNVTQERIHGRGSKLKPNKRQSRSTSLPRPCCYVRNNLNNPRASSCGPYITHGPSRKRQCIPALVQPVVSIQPCIPESQMASIEPVTYLATEMKESNIKRSNISLASSTCSTSKYAVDPVNELILSPMDEVEESVNGSLSRHGQNMKYFKHKKRTSSSTSADSIQGNFNKYIEESNPPTPTKMGRIRMTFFPHLSTDNIFRRKGGSKTSPTSSTIRKKWVENGTTSHTKLKTIPGSHPYGLMPTENIVNDDTLVIRKTKPDCCVIM